MKNAQQILAAVIPQGNGYKSTLNIEKLLSNRGLHRLVRGKTLFEHAVSRINR